MRYGDLDYYGKEKAKARMIIELARVEHARMQNHVLISDEAIEKYDILMAVIADTKGALDRLESVSKGEE